MISSSKVHHYKFKVGPHNITHITLAFVPKARRPMPQEAFTLRSPYTINLMNYIPFVHIIHVVNYGQLCSFSHGDIPPSLMVLFGKTVLFPLYNIALCCYREYLKCVTCCQKTWRECQINLKFYTQANYLMPRKKPQNNLFTWGPQHGQNGIWNLQIFFEYLNHLKIFGILFLGWCSTRPHNLIYILPEAIDFLCKFRSCSWLCSTHTQI